MLNLRPSTHHGASSSIPFLRVLPANLLHSINCHSSLKDISLLSNYISSKRFTCNRKIITINIIKLNTNEVYIINTGNENQISTPDNNVLY